MVSICGGEPLIYPKIEELVAGLLGAGPHRLYLHERHVHAQEAEGLPRQHLLAGAGTDPGRLLAEKLISDKDAETIRKGKHDGRPVIKPTKWMYWNVHIDGLEYTHDLIVEREGVFKECVEAVRMAKLLGYQVATNTTVYKETDVKEIEQMFEFFSVARSGRPHHFPGLRIRRRQEGHGQAPGQASRRTSSSPAP